MVALAPGERLHRLSRTGKVLADFPTMVSDGAPQAGPVDRFRGPFTPEISPDGTKVAYEWVNDFYDQAPGCTDTTVPPCHVFTQRQGVAISHADRYTGPEAFGLLTGWIFPHWMGEGTLLRSFSGTVLNDDAVFTQVGPGKAVAELDPWFFDDDQGFGVDDVELSQDLMTLVGVAGQNDENLRVYRPTTHPYGAPNWDHRPFARGNVPVAQRCGELTAAAGGKYETPSLSPDGRGLAYSDAAGVHVAPLPTGCAPVGGERLLVARARHPDCGPAAIPPASAYEVSSHAEVTPSSGHPEGPQGDGPGAGGGVKLSVKARSCSGRSPRASS